MTDDHQDLYDLNIKIGEAENTGNREWLLSILAPRLAFQRADEQQTLDDQVAFLQKIKSGGNRVTRVVEPIELYGNRAIVQCVVKADGKEFHNLRLFVRRDGDWKLLAWANEPM